MQKYNEMRVFCLQNGGEHAPIVKEEVQRRRQSEACYLLPFEINGNQAFVFLCKELDLLRNSIYQKHMKHMNLVSQIHQSNEYENVHSTRREIRDAMEDVHANEPTSTKRFYGMVKKYTMLISKTEIPLRTSSDIRKLYDEFVLDEVTRENPDNIPDGIIFRKDATHVVARHNETIHNGLMPESKIIEVMDQALSMLYDEDIDPLIRIAVFHYMFGYIHPFYDGNGRISRFISSYMLSRYFDTSACLRIAYVIKDHRTIYQRIFKEANDTRSMGDLTRFVIEFLRFFENAIDDAYMALEERHNKHQYYKELLEQYIEMHQNINRYGGILLYLLTIELFGSNSSSTKEIAEYSYCSENTIRTCMQICGDLVLKVKRNGTNKYFWRINLGVLDQLAEQCAEEV